MRLLLATVLSVIAFPSYAQPPPLEGKDFPVNQFPPPPPFNYGLTAQQILDLNRQPPATQKRLYAELERMWTPVWYHIPGVGRYWILPATGQKGFIPDTRR